MISTSWILDEVLYYYDGPKIFTLKHKDNLFLAYYCDDVDPYSDQEMFMLTPITKEQVESIKKNELDFNSILSGDNAFLVDIYTKMIVEPSFTQRKEPYVPKPGVFLNSIEKLLPN